jgi:predicted O-linked N-acetylglucosamine transferase (SPINDLY family)
MRNFQHSTAQAARADVHLQAGLRRSRSKQWKEAGTEFERAARLAPSDALIWLNLALSRTHTGQLEEAVVAAKRVLELEPANTVACRLAAECQTRLQLPKEAAKTFDALAPEAPRDQMFHREHGTALLLANRLREAVEILLKALALKVDDALVHYRLGLCFKDLDMPLESAECFRTAAQLDDGPVRMLALSPLVLQGRQACDWKDVDAETRDLLEAIDKADAQSASQIAPFTLLALEATPAQHLHLGRLRCEGLTAGFEPMPAPGPRKPGRIRIGYLSCDFYNHATSILVVELLERRDTERFEVFLYSHSRDDGSAIGKRVRAACEHFVDVNAMSHREIAQRMRDDGIDIAIDLKGHTRDSRMELLAMRPAPVQAAFLGYPGTSGAAFLDYLVGDPIVTPIEHAADFSERIAQLPGCYQPNDLQRALPPCPPRSELGLPDDAVVMCCFNQTYKLSPAMLDLWARILALAPRAVLWMLAWNAHAQANLLRELAARGVGPERVFFAPKIPVAGHLARLRAADLFLDTWPCNAHTTASEALWAGVPVLTVPGPTFASRVAASLVTACGLPDLACTDADHYVGMAAALANETTTLAALKEHLDTHRASLPLFDSERFTRDYEALLARMHERHLAGLAPDHLLANSSAAP